MDVMMDCVQLSYSGSQFLPERVLNVKVRWRQYRLPVEVPLRATVLHIHIYFLLTAPAKRRYVGYSYRTTILSTPLSCCLPDLLLFPFMVSDPDLFAVQFQIKIYYCPIHIYSSISDGEYFKTFPISNNEI